MRNLRKLTAVVIAIALVLTSMTAAFAATGATPVNGDKAIVLNELGLYAGVSSTTFDPDLESNLTREQGTILLLKLFGLDSKAAALTDAEVATALTGKTDAAKVSDWAKKAVAYAVANKIMSGKSATTVNPSDKITGAEFATLIVKTMGYDVADWTKAVTQLSEIKGSEVADEFATVNLTRDAAVAYMFGALTAETKDAKTLISIIVGTDAAKLAVAQEAGLVPATATATVKATGAKVLTAKFSSAVDTAKAAFAIKKGTVAVNVSKVEWNTAKTEATITLVSSLTKGDYVVTISGLDIKDPITVTAEDEKVASIEITSDVAPLVSGVSGNISFPYVVKNQYGEDVTKSYGGSLIWTPSTGTIGTNDASNKKVTVTGSFQKDQTLTVTAIYAAANVSATKLLKVGEVSKVAKINVLGIYNKDGKTLFTDSTFTDFYVKVEAFDQYGTAATLAQLDDASQVTVVSSNGTVVTKSALGFENLPDSTTAIGLQLAKPASNVSGTAVINFYVNANGTSAQQSVVVEKPATLTKLTLEAPADMVAIGESIKIPFTAQDQNGVELSETQKGAIPETVFKSAYTGLAFDFAYNYQTKKAELTLTVDGTATTGSKLIMAATDAGNVSQITLDVKAAAVPTAVSGVKNFAKLLTVGATSTISDDDVSVIDQYGRTMTLDAAWFAKYNLDISSATPANVSTSAMHVINADGGKVYLGGVATGTSTISIKVTKVTPAEDIANSNYEFTAETVAKTAIADYAVETPTVLYTDAAHKKAVTVYGKTSSGAKVALATSDYVIRTNDQYVTYDGSDLIAVATGMSADSEKTVTVIAIIAAADTKTISNTVTVTNKATVVKTLSVADVTVSNVKVVSVTGDTLYVKASSVTPSTFAGTLVAALGAKDQYDVSKTPVVTNLLLTNLDGVTVVNNGSQAPIINDAAAGDTFTLTYVTEAGLSKAVTVVIVP